MDNLYVNNLETICIDLRKLSDVVVKNILKKSKYNAEKQSLDKNKLKILKIKCQWINY